MSNIWNPMIEVESAHGTREIFLNTRHLMNRCIFLTGSIHAEMANAGLMIYDAIQGSSLEIHMICTGMAASMAAVILAGGQKNRRYILKHSKVMIHEPLIANGVMEYWQSTQIKR